MAISIKLENVSPLIKNKVVGKKIKKIQEELRKESNSGVKSALANQILSLKKTVKS